MILLAFAHRNEAQCFFEHFKLKSSPDIPQFWIGEKVSLIITGEGQFESLNSISTALARNMNISRVINLGIAGCLNEKFKNDDLVSIRTTYLILENTPQFKSFPLKIANDLLVADVLTSSKRIINVEERVKLSPLADLVDRELWSIGFACHRANVPLSSFKVISDTTSSEENNLCEVIKERASHYSELLLNAFIENVDCEDQNSQFVRRRDHELYKLLNHTELYFTLAMKRKFYQLMNKLTLQKENPELLKENLFSDILESDLSRKEKSLKVLESLTKILNPLRSDIENQLTHLTAPLLKSGWNIKYDANLEEKWISISSKVNGQADLEKLIQALEIFPLSHWENTFDGDHHV